MTQRTPSNFKTLCELAIDFGPERNTDEIEAEWNAALVKWQREISAATGVSFTATHSANFLVYSDEDFAINRSSWLLKSAERILDSVLVLLPRIAKKDALFKYIILVFKDIDLYISYVRVVWPDTKPTMIPSSGILVPCDVHHFVFPEQDLGVTEGILAHDLTRASLQHLQLPVWLEEGLAANVEMEVTGYPRLLFDNENINAHRNFWNVDRIQHFWSGSSFYEGDELSAFSRSLSHLLVFVLIKNYPAHGVECFIGDANFKDGGEQSAQIHLDSSLGDILTRLLNANVA